MSALNGAKRRGGQSALSSPVNWPRPLERRALYGVAGEWVDLVLPHTEADEAALLVQVLVGVGNMIGRTAHFIAEADRHHANLFAVVVGQTSKARKGTSWGQVISLLAQVDGGWAADRIKEGLCSGEGLIHHVRDRKTRVNDKGEEVVLDEGVADKRLLVVEEEFGGVLKALQREGNTLSPQLRQSWGKGNLGVLAKNSGEKATDAHISLIGHITRDELLQYLGRADVAGGTANRILWMCARRSKCLPEGGYLDTRELKPICSAVQAARRFASRVGELRRDEEAREMWHCIYPALSEGKPGVLGAVTSRAEAQVMRVALLYAVLDQSPMIRAKHLEASLALWSYCFESASYIFGEALGDPTADALLAALRRAQDGLTRREITKFFNNNKSSEQIDRALGLLSEHRMVDMSVRKSSTRPAEVWRADAARRAEC